MKMKKVRTVAIATLGFLAVSAIVGSLPLILDPHGTPWGFMSQSMLRFSPFHSYLIPGIILCLANGVPSLLVLTVTIRRRPGYSWWVALQGCILTGWMV